MGQYYGVSRSLKYLKHYGVKGMKWGVRKDTVFVSGSSKTEDKASPYYLRKLPKRVRRLLKKAIRNQSTILVGDAPGIDRQVQNYLNKKQYSNVEVYGPGTQVRYTANKKWKTHPINDPKHEPMSKEWLAKKDKAMTRRATRGIAVTLDEGSRATKENVRRLMNQNKPVHVYELRPKHRHI